MKKNRKSLKKIPGRNLLVLLLVAALTVGNMTTAFAMEKDPGIDETVTEETVSKDDGVVTESDVEETVADSESTSDDTDAAEDTDGTEETGDTFYEDGFSDDITDVTDALQEDVDDTEDVDDMDDEDGDEETGDTLHEDGLSDDTADVETAADWEATLPDELIGVWADDLIEVAKSQLGYTESTKNYRVNDAGKHKGYTRFGAWYGDPYGDWCAMFVSFCLHYTDIPLDEFPEAASCWEWTKTLDKLEMYETADSGYEPVPGDLIFFDNNNKNEKLVDHVGIVTEITEETKADGSTVTKVKTIEGNSGNMVREREYDIADSRIVGYGVLPENPDLEEAEEEPVEGGSKDDFMNDPNLAGACVGWDVSTMSAITADSGLWWIDDYYVDESSLYDVSKTDDFSLKYQIEFHASEDLAVGAVRIVIDASLGTYRNGNNIIPTELGIPYGTPYDYTETSASPFNYYYIDEDGNILTEAEAKTAEGVQLVIWNYRDIVSGSNAVFQVLYKGLDIMQIPDMTEWSLDVTVSVDTGDEENPNIETVNGNTLSGDVNTYARLTGVYKTAYSNGSVPYTPELYTKEQVSQYISGSIPEPYATNFDDYIYIVWRVNYDIIATQAWSLTEDCENTYITVGGETVAGFVVGRSVENVNRSYAELRSSSTSYYVVTAYLKEDYDALVEKYGQDSVMLKNDVEMTVHPYDGYDDDSTDGSYPKITWSEYEWEYEGNTIGITKSGGGTYNSWLDLYQINANKEQDTGEISFSTKSTDRGYGLTHYTEGTNVGEWIEGRYYTTTTVDDALYIYPPGTASDSRMLTKDDYYFSSVKVSTTDEGYDIGNDTTADPTEYAGVDQSVYIYAMFYDEDEEAVDEDGWEYVATVPFNKSGTMTYTFTSSDLKRQPYRVKAVHSTADYATFCTIDLGVTLRYDSPLIAWCYEYCTENGIDLSSLRIENLSGVAGQLYDSTNDGTYFQDTSTDHYSEKDTYTGETLAEFTEELYGTILTRDNAYATLLPLTETAEAYKSVTTENDITNGRILANYTITAYEAYQVVDEDTMNMLRDAGYSLPNRQDVAFCDLLPYGMQLNLSAPITAGWIYNMSGSWKTNAGAWETDGVTVTVGEDDIITNWNGTGRTMVIFHIHCSIADISGTHGNLWYQGYGISFQAYYDWSEIGEVDTEYNIAAYVAEKGEDGEDPEELLGEKGMEVFKDDGASRNYGDSRYSPFWGVSDLNGDGVTDLYTNMYASAITQTNVTTSSSDNIQKTVRADADAVAEYGSTAVVANGNTYTYEIMLTNNGGGTLSNVVLFDRLEYAVEDGRAEVDSVFSGLTEEQIEYHWTGTFQGVTTTALDDLGIDYTIYYSPNRNATVTSADGTTTPEDVLTEANGWYTEARYMEVYGSLDSVCAVAVDLGDYVMNPNTSVSIQIHMQGPEEGEYNDSYQYAFNNPIYYSVSTDVTGEETSATDVGGTVRVELGEAGILEVEKEFTGEDSVPDSMANQKFTFTLMRSGQALANQEYTIYNWNEETETWVSTGMAGATDSNGQFTLGAGQKAVFQVANVDELTVTEEENVFWDSDETDTSEGNEVYYLFENTYRSPIYFQKAVLTTDLATEEELADAEFTFKVLFDLDGDGEYEPYANMPYAYVTSALTDGSSPTILGYGETDGDGQVTLHIGEIIAFFPCDDNGSYVNVPYKIIEVESGEEWINTGGDTVEGETSSYGPSETITNYYKYRNLILTKDLSDYDNDLDSCEDAWTFRVTHVITDEEGKETTELVTGNHWYMIDADGNPVCDDTGEPIEGYLDSEGCFTFTGAGNGRRVVIEELVMGEKYILTETNWDADLYETVNDGTVDTTMPTYAITRSITLTNKYRLKDLEVSKLVLSNNTSSDISTHEFTFTLEKYEDGAYVPVAGAVYTIDGVEYTTNDDGTFTLKNNETAVFDDIGYQGDVYRVTEAEDGDFAQIYPADGDSYTGTLGSDGDSVRFINGSFDNVASIIKKLNGLDEVGEAYVDIVEEDNTQATLLGEEENVPYTVEVTFGVYDGDSLVTSSAGALIEYTDSNSEYPFVYIKISADGSYELMSYNGGEMTESLAPYDYIYIAEIGDYTVKASESADMERIILDVTDDVADEIGSEEILSEGEVMSGSAAANEDIVLVNNISSAHKGSEIFKLMTDESDEVRAGSQITFIVQIYDAESGTWSPASGIKYITMDGYTGEGKTEDGVTYHDTTDCWPTSGVLTTGSDGKITLTKTEEGYPYIRFTEDIVYVNVYDDAEDGTLRIVEASSGTDDSWGLLVGYDDEGYIGGPSLDITYGDTFYNGNDAAMQFEVEKEMANDTECDDDFTFYIRQILSVSTSPVTSMDQILDSAVGAGISYVIYDVESGKKIGEGVTDANGAFTLQPGQYAVFSVPEGTSWYVYEGLNPGYPLYSVEANDDEADPGDWGYSDQASIVDEVNGVVQNASSVSATGTIILTLTDADDGTPLAGATFDLYQNGAVVQSGLVTDKNGQIIVTGCTPGTYYFQETEAPDGYSIPDEDTSETVTVPEGLKKVTEYPVSMKNASAGVKYAVKLWGICADTYSYDGGTSTSTASLTFGPATGADHLTSYVECNSDTCIHKLSWDEIIDYCNQYQGNYSALYDLFGSCLTNGCTKAVNLTPNETLFNMATVENYLSNESYTGDGVSTLYYLLNGTGGSASNTYGATWNDSYTGYSNSDPANVYSRSRIRATLTGDSADAQAEVTAGHNDYYGVDTICDESNCLLSCFPANLQEAMVPRTTSNTGNVASPSAPVGDKTTYDKLFLFSLKEAGFSSTTDDSGGSDYGVNSGYAYEFNGEDATASSSQAWWSRSRHASSYYQAQRVTTSGAGYGNTSVSNKYGLSPGFCIR